MSKQKSNVKKFKPGELPADAYDRLPQAQLTFTKETVWLTRFDTNGRPTTTYPIALEDAAKSFQQVTVTSGFLPPETLFWSERDGKPRVGIYLPPQTRTLNFAIGARGVRLQVPLPGFVFSGEGLNYFLFAATERPRTEGSKLFHAPLPNVNPDGSICAGTVKFPPCTPASIHKAADLFFESGFNHDLSGGKLRSPGKGTTLFQFLQSLQKKRTFPAQQLVGSAVTLKRLIEGATAQ